MVDFLYTFSEIGFRKFSEKRSIQKNKLFNWMLAIKMRDILHQYFLYESRDNQMITKPFWVVNLKHQRTQLEN